MSVPTNNRTPFRAMAVGLIVVAVACVALTIYWLTVKSTFLASHYGHQPKHALVAGIVAVVALIGAGILWRQDSRSAPESSGVRFARTGGPAAPDRVPVGPRARLSRGVLVSRRKRPAARPRHRRLRHRAPRSVGLAPSWRSRRRDGPGTRRGGRR